ncbi:GT-D fold domain-containing protein [Rossellomorea sp. NS-SX7]|uniref:GT-D fold domain-containing protein n=1 Tax=Rossellomorea sp. NS-SX7 TaxID=3463856 RepID=UPI004058F6CD
MIDKLRNKFYKKVLKTTGQYNANALNNKEANLKIREAIDEAKPFMASRLGSVELSYIYSYYKKGTATNKVKLQMNTNAGFFPPSDNYLTKFAELYFRDVNDINLLGVWYNEGENVIFNKYNNIGNITELRNLEPYFSEVPWSASLKGKRVLVIHPFVNTINKQFQNHKQLFMNKNVLPEFHLKTIKAVQSISNEKTNFENWFEALEHMKEQIDNTEYDVAIIGAGAYGLPLAAHIKRRNKVAIHLGGATQILFGIKGKRWDNHPVISGFYNEYWTRPNTEEVPSGFQNVEKGCYW